MRPEIRGAAIPADAQPEEPEWLALHRVADAHDTELRDAVIEDRDSVLEGIDDVALAAAIVALSIQAAEDAVAWQTNSTLAERLAPGMEASAIEGAVVAQRFSPVTIDPDQVADAALLAARERVGELVAGLDDQTLRGIRTAISGALERGLSVEDALDLVQNTVGLNEQQVRSVLNFRDRLADRDVSPADIRRRTKRFARRQLRLRAQNVGRTETIAAVHLGQAAVFDVAATLDLIVQDTVRRRWIVTPDDRLDRVICAPMRNQVVGLDEKFITGRGAPIDRPPAHPRCRCSVAFEVEQEITVAKSKARERLILAQVASDQIRTEQFQGVEHRVVPVVALVEGVHHAGNVAGPELALTSEFEQSIPAWNGRPVTLGHPIRDGQPVSAGRPDVLEEEAVGTIFNTQVDGDRLRMEAWLDLEKIEEAGDRGTQLLERLEAAEQIEVSVGLFSLLEEVEGTHDGESFVGIWRNIVPDHLAMLPEGIKGACSWEDGCGAPRVNTLWHLKRHEPEEPGAIQRMTDWLRRVGDRLSFRGEQREVSDTDVRDALRGAIRDLESGSEFIWVVAVFPESGMVVYETDDGTFQRSFTMGEEGQVLSLGAERVEVRPVTEFVPVNPGPSQESIAMTKEARVQALIDHQGLRFEASDREWLLALEENQLERMEPAEAPATPDPPPDPDEPAPCATCGHTAEPATPPSTPPPTPPTTPDPEARTAEEYAQEAPQEIREMMLEGLSSARGEREELVKQLKALTQCPYDEPALAAMSLGELRDLAKLAQVDVYEGRPFPRQLQDDADDGFAAKPPSLWPDPSAAAGA